MKLEKLFIDVNLSKIMWALWVVPQVVVNMSTLSVGNVPLLRLFMAHHRRLVLVLAIFLIAKKLARKQITGFRLLVCAALFVVLGFSHRITGRGIRLDDALIIIMAVSMANIRDFIKFDVVVRIFSVAFVFLMAASGLIENNLRDRAGNMDFSRHALGFGHPNTAGMWVMSICLAWLYVRFHKLKWFDYIGVLVVSGTVFYFTRSQTSFFLTILAVMLFAALRIFKGYGLRDDKTDKVFIYFIPMMAILSTLSAVFYNPENFIWDFINRVTTGRPYYNNLFFENYRFSFFGQRVTFVGGWQAHQEGIRALILDNAYMALAINVGFAALLAVCTLYALASRRLLAKYDYPVVICIVIFGLLGLMEVAFFDLRLNWSLLLFGLLLLDEHELTQQIPETSDYKNP